LIHSADFLFLTELSNMTLLHKQKNSFSITIVVAIAISLMACAEKAEDSNQKSQTIIPPPVTVTEDKIAQLQREAQEGDSDAQYSLAYLYENGLGVPKNETKALELYQQAADQGHPEAQENLDTKSKSK
jgi:TPR repeat protein